MEIHLTSDTIFTHEYSKTWHKIKRSYMGR